MPVFPRAFPSDVHPLLRLLGDPNIYQYQQQSTSQQESSQPTDSHTQQRNAFSPNFDVHETEHAYVLEGELPGLSDKSAVNIEFTDHNTLLIRGRIERSRQASSPEPEEHAEASKDKHTPPKPTVEEEIDEEDKKQVAHAPQKKEVPKKQQPQVRYWLTERSIGTFQRTFNFPGLIDQDAVTAKLKDGILTVTVPKKQHTASRRIFIE